MILTVSNPRRLMLGGSLDVSDFPDVPGCLDVRIGSASDDTLALEVWFDHDLTTAEQQTVQDRCQSLNENEETLRGQARTALANLRTFHDSTAPQIISGANAIIGDATATANDVSLARGIKSLASQAQSMASQNIALIRMAIGQLDGIT